MTSYNSYIYPLMMKNKIIFENGNTYEPTILWQAKNDGVKNAFIKFNDVMRKCNNLESAIDMIKSFVITDICEKESAADSISPFEIWADYGDGKVFLLCKFGARKIDD